MIFHPRPHDKLSIRHLMTHNEAALFAGMGLGKTANTLTAFSGLQLLGLARAMLVIAPLRVATLTWPNEIEKWDHLRHLRYADLRKKEGYEALDQGEADIYLINYEQLQKFARQYLRVRSKMNFDTVTYDELTAAKNPGSKRIRAVRQQFSEEYGVLRRWGLTGTPTPNGLEELYAQIRVLDHGKRFGPSFQAWRDCYFTKADYMGYSWKEKPGAKAKIFAKIEDMVLSLPQQDHSRVPLPIEEDVEVTLPDKAREQYQELEHKLVLMLQDETELVAVNAAALVGKLIQITGGAVYKDDKSVVHIHDAKIDAAKNWLLSSAERMPCIVVCNYRHEKERLLKSIPQARTFQNHADFLRDWNRNKIPVLVVDPRELSHGLNLQEGGAHHILWYSQTYSREQYDQLNGRLARSGQKNQVHVARLICPGTINDAVVEALRQRGDDQRALMDTLQNFKRLVA